MDISTHNVILILKNTLENKNNGNFVL